MEKIDARKLSPRELSEKRKIASILHPIIMISGIGVGSANAPL